MNIQKLFKQVYKIAYEVQRESHNGQKIDGKRVWQEIEKSVEHINLPKMKYIDTLNDIYDMMDVIIDKYCMEINEYYPKSNHFFMQLKNLVVKKSDYIIKLNRVLQLAYNAGQLNYFLNSSEYNTLDQIKDIKHIYDDHNLNKLDTYISSENIEIINRIMNEQSDDIDISSFDMTNYLMKGGIRNDKIHMKIYHLKNI